MLFHLRQPVIKQETALPIRVYSAIAAMMIPQLPVLGAQSSKLGYGFPLTTNEAEEQSFSEAPSFNVSHTVRYMAHYRVPLSQGTRTIVRNAGADWR